MMSSSGSKLQKKTSKKRKNDDDDNPSSDNGGVVQPKKEKDRIKTLEQFQTELNLMMEKKKEYDTKKEESSKTFKEYSLLKARVVPFMLENLKQSRVDCSAHNMYVSATTVKRFRKVKLEDVYQIIEEVLGKENKALIQQKALELREQKVSMKQIRIADISDVRATRKKEREEAMRQAVLSGQPIPKKRAVKKQ